MRDECLDSQQIGRIEKTGGRDDHHLPFRSTDERGIARTAVDQRETWLVEAIGERLRAMSTLVEVLVPFERGDIMASVHRSGQVTSEQSSEGGMLYTVRLDDASASRLSEFIVGQH